MSSLRILSLVSLAALAGLALTAPPAHAASLALSPDAIVAESAYVGANALSGSLSLTSVSFDSGEMLFRLDAAILGPSEPTLQSIVEVTIDFGSTLVAPQYSLQFLSGGVADVFYLYPCPGEYLCNQIHFALRDPSIALVSVFSDLANFPSQVTLTLNGYTKIEPLTPLVASGSGELVFTPEPALVIPVALALGLLTAARFFLG